MPENLGHFGGKLVLLYLNKVIILFHNSVFISLISSVSLNHRDLWSDCHGSGLFVPAPALFTVC